MSGNRQRTTSFADGSSTNKNNYSTFNSRLSKDEKSFATVMATPGSESNVTVNISYYDTKVIGNGSFGIVYQARLKETDEVVAIKKVLQDKRFKNRELQIMKALDHCNIVKLKYFFYSSGAKKDEVYLNLLLEFIPDTVYKVAKHYSKSGSTIPNCYIKLYMYQLFRSLAYIHSLGICHRDIKPQNLLLNSDTGVLKLCDFGSAKVLIKNEPNVSYICSRYYRAPELIFGAINYTTKIDVWSAGCVFAELLMRHPIFPGDSSVDQLVEIIKVLGTPSRDQIFEMNPNYTEFKFPQIRAHPWPKVFRSQTPPEAIRLISKLLEYVPSSRMNPADVCIHAFFDELRNPQTQLPNGRPLPPLFNFTEHELRHNPQLSFNRFAYNETNTTSTNNSNTGMSSSSSSNNNMNNSSNLIIGGQMSNSENQSSIAGTSAAAAAAAASSNNGGCTSGSVGTQNVSSALQAAAASSSSSSSHSATAAAAAAATAASQVANMTSVLDSVNMRTPAVSPLDSVDIPTVSDSNAAAASAILSSSSAMSSASAAVSASASSTSNASAASAAPTSSSANTTLYSNSAAASGLV